MSDSSAATSGSEGPRRVQAVVALRVLEVMRDRDLPVELLEDEDPTRTIPRRFGLSDVVERQIRAYQEDVRRRVKLSDGEVRDLLRLVIRRPDGPEVMHEVGRLLAGRERPAPWVRMLPQRLRYRAARSTARKQLRRLFGRPIGGFAVAPFAIEGRALMFIESDPGGDACYILSGFCQEILGRVLGGTAEVRHTRCQALGDELCRWEGALVEPAAGVAAGEGRGSEDVARGSEDAGNPGTDGG